MMRASAAHGHSLHCAHHPRVPRKSITFRAEPRQSVILDTKNTPSTPAIGVRLQNYIVIDGFVIPSAEAKGLQYLEFLEQR